MKHEDITAIVIVVPEAAFTQPFRVKYTSALMPAHITLHVPFKLRKQVDENVLNTLAELFKAHSQFSFTLTRTARFSDTGVLYLVPEPAEPLLALSRAIQARYPDTPPDYPDQIMHLTLGLCKPQELDRLEQEFNHQYGTLLPIEATVTEVCIFEHHDNAWFQRGVFALGQC